ncbi:MULTISPECIES: hypothetical protein [Acinetobacter]|uniref:Uncharacterized protein n=1 Tax=Acinetobacter higginsii TaxID=70347 RepID=N8WC77_9GAMM|nr:MULTISPECIES: hypothetical protein [Acinetobacter]ENV09511.1 hypothetical protein F966_02169 [Acinetobacter higginsii]MCI3877736.1 hypothetical protein [Acinetobacter higginsii]MCJ0828801.1 hypothetical protein [Acinetobacter sp. NIPH1876]
MSSDVEKQIAFEMTKSIVLARDDVNTMGSSSLQFQQKIGDVDYWLEIYHQCLDGLKSPKKPLKIEKDVLGSI